MLLRFILVSFCLQHACLQPGWSQTQIDLQAQSKNVDFSTSAATRPLKSGVTLPSTCTVGAMFFLTSSVAGANLYGCTTTNTWALESSAGAENASQLTDLAASRSSSTTLLIGAACSTATPCNVRFGGVTFSFASSTSATISGGSGTAFIYVDSSGNLTVGHNLTLACSSGCVAVAGITAFPPDSVPLFTWTATSGTWDSSGGVDRRAFQSTTNVSVGAGLLGTVAGGRTTLSIDPTLVGIRAAVPSSSSSVCSLGTWSMDTSFYYVCVAANSWRRVALTTW
jgi:hypothetical protein